MTEAQKARMLAALSPPAPAGPAAKRGKISLFEHAEIYVIEDELNLIAELKADKNLVAALGDIHDMSCALWDKNKGKFYEVSVPQEGSDIKAMIEVSFVCDGKYVVCRALADTGSSVTIMRASYWEKFLKGTEATVKVFKFKHKKNFSAANNGQVMCDSLVKLKMYFTPEAYTVINVFLTQNLAKEIILGNDVLGRLGASVDLNMGQVTLARMDGLAVDIVNRQAGPCQDDTVAQPIEPEPPPPNQ